MADVSEIINKKSSISMVDKTYEDKNKPRTRLGLSQCGNDCERYLWYCHHRYVGETPDGRTLRLFQLGNILEDQTVSDLISAGFNVHSSQKEVTFTHEGETLTGSIDGIVEGLIEAPSTPHLFEHKTCSKKKYDELLKKGSYREWNNVYYWQTQFYMLGLNLKRAAVFVYCKDDSRIYMERIHLDKDRTIDKLQDIFKAISLPTPPVRTCPDADNFKAKWCPFYSECWGVDL